MPYQPCGQSQCERDLASLLQHAIDEGVFPGAYAAIGHAGHVIECGAGSFTYEAQSSAVNSRSIFDLASLTKVIATATAIMLLVQRRELALEDRADRYLSKLNSPPKSQITIRHLLCHMAGFPSHVPLLEKAQDRESLLDKALSLDLSYRPGQQRIYDDISYIVLGLIIEAVSSAPLDAYCRTSIFEPLGMTETMFNPPSDLADRIVPTEWDARLGVLRGTVHDENARALGGVSGHAGLFSTGRDLLRFCESLRRAAQEECDMILSAATVRRMLTVQWRDAGGEYALGWDKFRPTYMNGLGNLRAFGHTGFTGTSVVISPHHSLTIILLTNRVHPDRNGPSIDPVRRAVAEMGLKIAR